MTAAFLSPAIRLTAGLGWVLGELGVSMPLLRAAVAAELQIAS